MKLVDSDNINHIEFEKELAELIKRHKGISILSTFGDMSKNPPRGGNYSKRPWP